MKTNFGAYYLESSTSEIKIENKFSVKRLNNNNRWLVFNVNTDEQIGIVPSRLRAYYVATILNGRDVSTVFNFGSGMFG